ncbi:MAG TPA: thiamine phosphate synthase [Niastella sp.]
MFSLIVISGPTMLTDEASIIQQLFAEGLEVFHLRKPNADEQAVRQLIEAIPAEYHDRIVMHGFFHLMEEYGMHRLHLREEHRQQLERNGFFFEGAIASAELARVGLHKLAEDPSKCTLSTSVHDLQTLQSLSVHFSYSFFSPVFDSISKQQYKGVAGDDFYLKDEQKAVPVIALGGIDADNVSKLPAMNFDGAALLGAIWNEPEKAVEQFKKINHAITTTIRIDHRRF